MIWWAVQVATRRVCQFGGSEYKAFFIILVVCLKFTYGNAAPKLLNVAKRINECVKPNVHETVKVDFTIVLLPSTRLFYWEYLLIVHVL